MGGLETFLTGVLLEMVVPSPGQWSPPQDGGAPPGHQSPLGWQSPPQDGSALPRTAESSPGRQSPPQDDGVPPRMAVPSLCNVFGVEGEATFVTLGASHTGKCTKKPRNWGGHSSGGFGPSKGKERVACTLDSRDSCLSDPDTHR